MLDSSYFCKMNQTKQQTVEKAMVHFKEGFACSQSVILAFANEFNLNKNHALAMSSTMGGGMGRLRRTCGAVSAGFMVIGLKYGNTEADDLDNKLNAYRKVREMNKHFEAIHGSSICKDLLAAVATDDEVKHREHHRMICDNCVKTATELTYDILDQDFSCV